MACWCAGSAVASGLVVPILIIGAAFGRICGLMLVDISGTLYTKAAWNWIDPGAFALIGAASFFGGVSRLTISLTVIMMEITNDIRFLLPIMTAILISKLAADQITHSLYHALLELKCIPFIGSDPPPSDTSLDLHPVSKIMNTKIMSISVESKATNIINLLKKSNAHAFPVVDGNDLFLGIVLRKHVLNVLREPPGTELTYDILEGIDGGQEYEHEISAKEEIKLLRILNKVSRDVSFHDVVDTSAVTVKDDFPISRAFIIFRSLGLRHMTIVNKKNNPVGMISRKDLLGMHIEKSLHHNHHHDIEKEESLNPLDEHLD
jgi:chloride channel 7